MQADRKTVLDFEKIRKTPVVDTTVHDNYMVLLNANSYQKGGWVLHMLRRKLGEEAYWKGIRNYYAKYDGGNANSDDLRNMMEQASGQDLKSFFKQWLYTAGTPHLYITWKYIADKKAVELNITQKQNTLFDFPLEFSIGNKLHTMAVKNKTTTVQIPLKEKPASVIIDPNVNLLSGFEVKEEIE